MQIPFEALQLITFHAVPNDVNVVKMLTTLGSEILNCINETIENFGPDFGNGPAMQHTILGTVLSSGEKYVVDPTSMQHGLRKDGNKLMYYGSWDEYMSVFPGKYLTLMFGGWKHDKDVEKMLGTELRRRTVLDLLIILSKQR